MKKYLSLRWKLTALIAAGSVITAAISAAGFCWFDLHRFWVHSSRAVEAIGSIVADQAGPAISLSDRKAAGDILASLRADTYVMNAVLYDANGRCFAEFHRVPSAGCSAMPATGVRRAPGLLILGRPIVQDGERLGTLRLEVSVPSLATILSQYLGSAALILLLSLLVAAVLAMVLQARVSAPILSIARVAEHIAQTHRFEERVKVAYSDELGVLAEAFNSMLTEIDRRDVELQRQRKALEEEVAQRIRANAELRLAKEAAEEAARLKTEFLANMSHEIRTPMNGVTGMISLLLDGCDDAEQRDRLLVAQTAAQSLVVILNDILDLSKIEAGRMTLESFDFDLTAVLQESARIFESVLREKNLELTLSIAPGCPRWAKGDPVRLRQILLNLVGNAVKFTLQGCVAISAGPTPSGTLLFQVRDTGIGIPATKLESIFEPFTQADGSHTRQFGGTGLGLTITRRLTGLMGGRVWATSEVGCGSTFSVELPLAAGAPPSANPASLLTPVTAAGLPIRNVLVAEDNVVNQKVITSILRRQGWSVTLAGNGEEAYRHFLATAFDLILMDVQMPVMDGLEAARLIRGHEAATPSRGHTPIVALTAHASGHHESQCIEAGMDAVITKPVNVAALIAGIAAVVSPAPTTGPSVPSPTSPVRG